MMTRSSQRLILAIVSLCLLGAVGWSISLFRNSAVSSATIRRGDPAAMVKEIAGYRAWSKANSEPQVMPDVTATLCAPASDLRTGGPRNPHLHRFLTVYVNDVGRKAMLEQMNPTFPEGSVIVKEKLSDKSSQTPELLTVMIKREKGFNPANGDWEYMVVDGTGTKVEARGTLENCQSCHSARKQNNYVFRTYLPDDVMTKLK